MPAGGEFRLAFQGETTAVLAYNATAAQVESALEDLNAVNQVTVTGSAGARQRVEVNWEGWATSRPCQTDETSCSLLRLLQAGAIQLRGESVSAREVAAVHGALNNPG